MATRACIGGGDDDGGISAARGGTATTAPTPRFDGTLRELTGFVIPLDGACLPDLDNLLPGARRDYRNGVHEGVDFYPNHVCVLVERGTPVRAARDGVVIRADTAYRPLTRSEARRTDSDPATLDRFRGRQVWVDHGVDERSGQRVITRYAHLDSIASTARVGVTVRAGQVIAFVGNSGTPEGLDDPKAELHLHFEVRIGEGFLGQGMELKAVREAYERLFSNGRE